MTRLPEPDNPRIEVILFSGDRLTFGPFELARVLIHRNMLVQYVLLGFFLTIIDTRSGLPRSGMNDQALIVSFCILAAVPFLLLVTAVLDLIARHRGRVLRIHASPVLASVALVGVVAGDVGEYLVMGYATRVERTFALFLFYYVLVETVAHLLVLLVMPRALRDIRERAAGRGQLVTPARPVVAEVPDQVEIGGRRIAAEALIRITAEGNYLRVYSGRQRMYLPGPFGRAVEQLPESLGVRVSRSDWVALRAVRALRREGRDLYLDLMDGATVKVANARQKVVLSLLDLAGMSDQGSGSERSIQSG